jgi:glycosyltransferase involved in cell wall biosynthesis
MNVSVVTPTYHRRQFIPALITIYKLQTYSKELMEWIILDDGQDKVGDLFKDLDIPNIRYIPLEDKLRIGAKRNRLNAEAKGDIIIAMDDDDYYPPERIQSVVTAFQQNPRIDLAGSSQMYLYYLDTQKVYTIGPYMPNHATNGTMAWRKRYAEKHHYNEFVTKGEETSFLDNYANPMIQLDPLQTILVICHTDNTVDKTKLRQQAEQKPTKDNMRETKYKLQDIVKEPTLIDFYSIIDST